jgi:hypothetical protein
MLQVYKGAGRGATRWQPIREPDIGSGQKPAMIIPHFERVRLVDSRPKLTELRNRFIICFYPILPSPA